MQIEPSNLASILIPHTAQTARESPAMPPTTNLNVITDPQLLQEQFRKRRHQCPVHERLSCSSLDSCSVHSIDSLQRKVDQLRVSLCHCPDSLDSAPKSDLSSTVDQLLLDLDKWMSELSNRESLASPPSPSIVSIKNENTTSRYSNFFDYLRSRDSLVSISSFSSRRASKSYSQLRISELKSRTLSENEEVILPPSDGTLASLSAMPGSFSGWLQKKSGTNIIQSSKFWKLRYAVLSNSTLYFFTTNSFSEEFYDHLTISETTLVRFSDQGSYCLEVIGECISNVEDYRQTYDARHLHLNCRNQEDLKLWYHMIQNAISEAVNGRKPLPFVSGKYSNESLISPLSPNAPFALDQWDFSFPTPTQTNLACETGFSEYPRNPARSQSAWTAIYENGTAQDKKQESKYPSPPISPTDLAGVPKTPKKPTIKPDSKDKKPEKKHESPSNTLFSITGAGDIYDFVENVKMIERKLRGCQENIFVSESAKFKEDEAKKNKLTRLRSVTSEVSRKFSSKHSRSFTSDDGKLAHVQKRAGIMNLF